MAAARGFSRDRREMSKVSLEQYLVKGKWQKAKVTVAEIFLNKIKLL